jgi:hypothetical protein
MAVREGKSQRLEKIGASSPDDVALKTEIWN